jgi:hypothetical protein
MASYASYQQHSMGFNSHEFNFPPYTCDAEQSYLPATTCDDSSFIMGYPQQGYSHNMNEPYPFNPEQLQQLARYDMNQQHSQLKADYSFEHQPPVLSSTSDSGASIQSAMSSNTGTSTLTWAPAFSRKTTLPPLCSSLAPFLEKQRSDVLVSYQRFLHLMTFLSCNQALVISLERPGQKTRRETPTQQRTRRTRWDLLSQRRRQITRRTTLCRQVLKTIFSFNSQLHLHRLASLSSRGRQLWSVSRDGGKCPP